MVLLWLGTSLYFMVDAIRFAYSHLMNTQTSVIPQAPPWAPAMKTGHWYRISGDSPDLDLPPTAIGTRYLKDNDPAYDPALNPPASARERIRRLVGREWQAPWSGRSGFPALTEAWNGAVYASGFGTSGSMVIFGGGHDDYYGSDVHAFDLAARTWRRLSDGFVMGEPKDYGEGAVYADGVYPDGSPLPPHTYGYVQYDALGNDFLLLKSQTELGPKVKAAAIPQLFNLDSLTWRSGPEHPSAILNSGGFTTWDPSRRLLWGHSGDDGGGNAFVAYSPDGVNPDSTTGSWRECHGNKLPGEASHNAMQFHPAADKIVVALHARDALAVIDPNCPGDALATVTSRGPKPRIRECAALEYSAGMGSLVYCSAADSATVYGIDWDADARWYVVSVPAGPDPVADAAAQSRYPVNRAHTFGRFRIAHFDAIDLAVLIRHVDSAVYAMRLTG